MVERIEKSEAERRETLAVNEATNAFSQRVFEALGDRVIAALADTEHVHHRALVASREEVPDLVGSIIGGSGAAGRVVVPIVIRLNFGKPVELSPTQLMEYMAHAKAAVAKGRTPDDLPGVRGTVIGLLQAWWGGPAEPGAGDERDDDEVEGWMRALAKVAGVSVPAWAEVPATTCVRCSMEFYSSAPARNLCPACARVAGRIWVER